MEHTRSTEQSTWHVLNIQHASAVEAVGRAAATVLVPTVVTPTTPEPTLLTRMGPVSSKVSPIHSNVYYITHMPSLDPEGPRGNKPSVFLSFAIYTVALASNPYSSETLKENTHLLPVLPHLPRD